MAELLEGIFFRGAKVFRALVLSWPPSGGKSPKDDCVLKTPLLWWRSGNEWSIELKEDELDDDFDVASGWVFCVFESPLTIVANGAWISLKNKTPWDSL